MNELLEKNQTIRVIPKNFKNANKGKILDIRNHFFTLNLVHPPEGIEVKKIVEFYSPTKHGMLYFTSSIVKVEGNKLVVVFPRKHRFLQRRTFTRIKFIQNLKLKNGKDTFEVKSVDLSAGGMKLITDKKLDMEQIYNFDLTFLNDEKLKCEFEVIKMEKNEDEGYTLAGRFKNLSDTDKMKIIQFCIRKNLENLNK